MNHQIQNIISYFFGRGGVNLWSYLQVYGLCSMVLPLGLWSMFYGLTFWRANILLTPVSKPSQRASTPGVHIPLHMRVLHSLLHVRVHIPLHMRVLHSLLLMRVHIPLHMRILQITLHMRVLHIISPYTSEYTPPTNESTLPPTLQSKHPRTHESTTHIPLHIRVKDLVNY